MDRRIKILQIVFLVWFILLTARLVYWQVIKSSEMTKLALSQYGSFNNLPAPRGQILSADGYPMAMDQERFLLYLEPKKYISNSLAEEKIVEMASSSESAKEAFRISRSTKLSWLPVSHGLSTEQRSYIESLRIPGIGFEIEMGRQYLSGSLSAYLTGFVGKNEIGDSQGYFGLEGYYDRTLSGRPGIISQDIDAFGKPIVISDQKTVSPQPGQNVITSIDRTVQYLAFKYLQEGLEKYQATSGTISVMDVKTGRILAMVSLPSYDPNNFTEFSTDVYKNPLVSDAYEPGSTFKTVVMASALDANVVTPDTICDACSGPKVISGAVVKNYNDEYHPNTTMTDVILHSDNIGMIFVSRKMGKSNMLERLRKFGFGKLTGVDLQEESTPQLRPDDQWQDIDWATASFGQGIAVTRLQMLSAVNAIANGGKLIPPRIATGFASGKEVRNLPLPQSTQVISQKSALLTTQIMTNAVNKGEVRYYKIPGYQVAGKTGTAQVPIAGHYDETKFIASFIGFAPAQDPKFTMLVTLREPKTSKWGSTTAAPLWFKVAEQLFRYYRIPPKS